MKIELASDVLSNLPPDVQAEISQFVSDAVMKKLTPILAIYGILIIAALIKK